MTNSPIIFQTTFEDVLIQFTSIDVSPSYLIPEDTVKQVQVANLYAVTIDTSMSDNRKTVSGDIKMTFMNQGDNFNMFLFVSCNFIATSENDNSGKSIFHKLIQYIFIWTTNHVVNTRLKDKNGSEFIMPHFGYEIKDYWNVED